MEMADSIPRYAQPMDVEPVGPFCGECAYYRELPVRMRADGRTHYFGACCYEVAQGGDALVYSSLTYAEPEDEACGDFKEVP